MICLLPISFLSKALVPWAEGLGEVTTEAGVAPPGDATVTDASLEEEIPLLEYRYSYSQFATQNDFLRYAYDGVWKPATSSAYGDGQGTGNHCAEYVGAVLRGWYTEEKAPTSGKTTVSEVRQALANSGYWTEVYANANTFVNCTQSEAGYDAVLASIGVQPGDVLCFVRNSLEYGHAEHTGIYGGTTTSGTAILLEQSNSAGWHAERAGAYIDNARSAGTTADKYCTGAEVKYENGTTVSDTNAPKFSDTPIPVNLTVQKKNGNPTPQQGSTGDVTLEGAVFALYAQRDVVDTATGEIKARSEKYTVDTPLTHKDGTPVIDPTTGKQVIAKAGDSKPLQISEATGVDGKITFKDIFAAKNADDYYVVELCAPKDFYRDKAEHSVDLRDNRTDAEKSDVNYTALSKHLDVTDQPIMQPIHVKKYVPVKDGNTTKIEPLNGAEFSVYLISSLKGDTSACNTEFLRVFLNVQILLFTMLLRVCYGFCVDKILIYQHKVLFRLV